MAVFLKTLLLDAQAFSKIIFSLQGAPILRVQGAFWPPSTLVLQASVQELDS